MKTNGKRISARLLKVFLLFLLCAGVLTACGKDKAKKNGSDVATPTVTTVPATATPSPTPTIAFVPLHWGHRVLTIGSPEKSLNPHGLRLTNRFTDKG